MIDNNPEQPLHIPSHVSISRTLIAAGLMALPLGANADIIGNGPALGPPVGRTSQSDVRGGNLHDVRQQGLKVFTVPFNKKDGHGDGSRGADPNSRGPHGNGGDPSGPNSADSTSHFLDEDSGGEFRGVGNTNNTGRPNLQDPETGFLRTNGLDSQTCLECHGLVSSRGFPFEFGVGGHAGINASPLVNPTQIDVDDSQGNGFAGFNGRLINPPDLFGAGGTQLVGQEMTRDLQELRQQAENNPGTTIDLVAKGVSFGSITCSGPDQCNTDNVEGIDADLVVRPFGRKGSFATTRGFDGDAAQFHLGMQAAELVGRGEDPDRDGVSDELTRGEMSALEVFLTTQDRPVEAQRNNREQAGFQLFRQIGCAGCHQPFLDTERTRLTYAFPEEDTDPFDRNDGGQDIYYSVRLDKGRRAFENNPDGGLRVRLFSDLKRHDMGPRLTETVEDEEADNEILFQQNREFITAKLFGVADSAPYLHDGRAQTLFDAIEMHGSDVAPRDQVPFVQPPPGEDAGSEAQDERDAFLALSEAQQNNVIRFLLTLRNPDNPNRDVVGNNGNGNNGNGNRNGGGLLDVDLGDGDASSGGNGGAGGDGGGLLSGLTGLLF